MDTCSTEVVILPVLRHSIPAEVRDIRQSYQKQLAIYFILASTLFERVAFYSLAANIVLILKSRDFGWHSPNSVTALYIFSGTSYISTLLFAAVSDAKTGRAKTIIIGFIPYLIGYIMIIVILYDGTKEHLCHYFNLPNPSLFHENCAPSILPTLMCIAIGAGAVQSNMAVFGAEQIQESKLTSRYFDKYMVAVNIGGIIATSVIPYIEKNPEDYYIGCIVAFGMLFLAAVLFIVGWRYYIHIEPYDTVITMCIPVLISAIQSWYRYKMSKRSLDKERLNSTPMNLLDTPVSHTEEKPSTFLDFAKAPNGGKFHDRIVDNVKALRGALVVFTLLIPFWLIYDQLDATFPLQGEQMDTLGQEHMITWISLGDPVTIIVGIIILNMFVYKYLDTDNPIMEIATKFVIGMCFASITMCVAGVMEGFRQEQCHHSHNNNRSSLTIYAQLPQNVFMGFSELFATVASYEYAYFAAPRSAQSLFMSLRFFSLGISSVIGTIYINVFSKAEVDIDFTCPSDKNWQWSFYMYFFILAGVQLLTVVILIVCQKKFEIIKLNPEKMEHTRFR